jgi:hypothetical protein
MRRVSIRIAGLALALAACERSTPTAPVPAPSAELVTSGLARDPAALVFAPDAPPYGTSRVGWSERWWQWALSFPASASPALDQTGQFCAQGQTGHVWFMEVIFGAGSSTRACTIPHDTALLLNLSGILNDYPCPDPTFQPAPGQSLADFLTQGAQAVVNGVNGLTLTVDGAAVPGLFGYRATSPLFYFTGDQSLAAVIDPCIQGTRQPAVSDGYFIILKPLPPGEHAVVTTASDVAGNFTSLTFKLTVE